MAGTCRIFCQNLSTPLSKMISTKLRVSFIEVFRHYSHGEQQEKPTIKQGTFAEFFEKTQDNKQAVEEDQDFEVLLRNSNFINVTYNNFNLINFLCSILFYSLVIRKVNM